MKLESDDAMGMRRLVVDGVVVGIFRRDELIELRDWIDAQLPLCFDPDPNFVVPGRVSHY